MLVALTDPPVKPMSAPTRLPGLDAAQNVLRLTPDEITRALHADRSTVYRWRREGKTPIAIYQNQLQRLEDLADTLTAAFTPEQIQTWLHTPSPVFQGRTPKTMILDGRTETVLGALLSHRHLIDTLKTASAGDTPLSRLLQRDDLSLGARAAIALLDAETRALIDTDPARDVGADALDALAAGDPDQAAPAARTPADGEPA
jgi:hypothetical protein